MATTTCGYCNARTHMTLIDFRSAEVQLWVQGHPMDVWRIDAAYVCDACHRMSVAGSISKEYVGEDERLIDDLVDRGSTRWEPQAVANITFQDVPATIGNAAAEVHRCASIGAHMAAILLARAVIESAAKAHNAVGRDLRAYIDWLGSENLLLPGIVAAAHEVRFLGNDMAHGDFRDEPLKEDADEILAIMDDVLEALFTQPARTARLAEARAARRAERSSTTP